MKSKVKLNLLLLVHLIVMAIFVIKGYWNIAIVLLVFTSFYELEKERIKNVNWKQYIKKSIIFIAFFSLFCIFLKWVWKKYLIKWEVHGKPHLFHLDETFQKIPFNDASFLHVLDSETVRYFLSWIYDYGFIFAAVLVLIRCLLEGNTRKTIHSALSLHALQGPIITLFYITFDLKEVWYVLGDNDHVIRDVDPGFVKYLVINCFPSMHTSIAFGMILLSLRDKNTAFKWIKIVYGILIIFSTLYLKVHWVIDVIGGMIFAYAILKLADFMMKKRKATPFL